MGDIFQVVLSGKHCSGRAVRFRTLSAAEHDKLTLDAAKQIGPEGTMLELRKLEYRNGVRAMIVGISSQSGLKELSKDVVFKKVDPFDLDSNWSEYFNPKDEAVLTELYRSFHEVTQSEIDDISGKIQMVSVDEGP